MQVHGFGANYNYETRKLNMEVEQGINYELKIKDLHIGETFEWDDEIFIKVSPKNGKLTPIVCLSNGELLFVEGGTEVRPVRYKAVKVED